MKPKKEFFLTSDYIDFVTATYGDTFVHTIPLHTAAAKIIDGSLPDKTGRLYSVDAVTKRFGHTPKITVVDEFKNHPTESFEIGSIHRTPKVMAFGYEKDEDFDVIIDRKYCDCTKDYIHRNLDAIARYYMTKAYFNAFKNNPRRIMHNINMRYGIMNSDDPYSFPPNYCFNVECAVASFKKQAVLVYEELSKYIAVQNNEYKAITKFCTDMDISKGSVLFYKLIAEKGIKPRLKIIDSWGKYKSMKDRFFDYRLDDGDTINTFTVQSHIPRSPFNVSDPTNRKQKRKKAKETEKELKSMTAVDKYNTLTKSGYFDFLESTFGLYSSRYSMKHLLVADQIMSRQNNK